MKVLGLKDFDQHISPLSLTFHWTRVFSSLAFSPTHYHNPTFCISVSSPSFLLIWKYYRVIYICKYLSGIFKHFTFRNLPKDHDQYVVFWLISASVRQTSVQCIKCPLSVSAFLTMGKSALHAKGCEVPCQTVANHSISMSVGLKWRCVSN